MRQRRQLAMSVQRCGGEMCCYLRQGTRQNKGELAAALEWGWSVFVAQLELASGTVEGVAFLERAIGSLDELGCALRRADLEDACLAHFLRCTRDRVRRRIETAQNASVVERSQRQAGERSVADERKLAAQAVVDVQCARALGSRSIASAITIRSRRVQRLLNVHGRNTWLERQCEDGMI